MERLRTELFGGVQPGDLTDELTDWIAGSRRFRAFVERYRDKVRKKLRGAREPEARRDLRAELRVAALLLADRRIELEFEAYGATVGGPDFTLTYRSARAFNLEVTRPHGPATTAAGGPILPKLRQLPPSIANLLVVAVPESAAFDGEAAARQLRARADARDDAFFAARGFRDARDARARLARLGAVVTWAETTGTAVAWTNPAARIAVSRQALAAVVAALGASAAGMPAARG